MTQETEENHRIMVTALRKPGEAIMEEMTAFQADMLHMAVGVSGESGELLDAIKKHAIYGKPLDIDNVVEELGDLEFYMEGLRQVLALHREDTLDANFTKLTHSVTGRFKAGTYSNEAAIERNDK